MTLHTTAPTSSIPQNLLCTEPADAELPVRMKCREECGKVAPLDLSWQRLSYAVKLKDGSWQTLVHPTTGTARAGRVVALLGPSGAGKTTLMNSICGRVRINAKTRFDGAAFLNDVLLRSKYRKLVSFLAQDDVILGYETPREALAFSHRLRRGASAAEAADTADRMLERLRLTNCADTVVGVPGLVKGVSGGEKKRANIGTELINNPQILLLDEPTTGLDSVTALRVCQLLRDLAHEEQRTVLCTLHTPSSQLFDCFDDILLLSHGRVVYHGDREEANEYFAAAGHPVPRRTNPAEHFTKLLHGDTAGALAERWAEHLGTPAAAGNACISSCPPVAAIRRRDAALDRLAAHNRVGLSTQLRVLAHRSLRNTYRDPTACIGRMVQTAIFAAVTSLLFFQMGNDDVGVQDRRALLYMLAVVTSYMAAELYVGIFPAERAIFLREMANDSYNAGAYYLAKVLSDLPMAVLIPMGSVAIVYWIAGLAPSAGAFFSAMLTVVVVYNTAGALGMFVASLSANPDVGTRVVDMVLLPLLVVGGSIANTERLDPYWNWLMAVSFPRCAFKALHHIEFTRLPTINGQYFKSGEEVRVFDGFDGAGDVWWVQVLVMLAMMALFHIAGALSLTVQGRWQRSTAAFDRYDTGIARESTPPVQLH